MTASHKTEVAGHPFDASAAEVDQPRSEQQELRQRIISQATRLFAEKGFSATSIRELARACDCTRPALYYYFDSKENLFRYIVQQHLNKIRRMITNWTGTAVTMREGVHEAIDMLADYAEANPDIWQLLQRLETRPETDALNFNILAVRKLHLQMLGNIVARGIANDEVNPSVDPGDCAIVITGTLSVQFELALATGQWDRPRLHRTIELIFNGIAA
ncbi:MAG: TetR/AcrR family transcriptional regulator [Proteobacteria bacterium]|nr:TetR/AcrR family transcriptional regulator [Pseudomonadota bacterium]